MAAFSIGFDHAVRRPWDKRRAVIGTDAPGGTLAIQIRISDDITGTANWKPQEIRLAIIALADRMLEARVPSE